MFIFALALKPLSLLKIPVSRTRANCRYEKDNEVAVLMLELRHVLEIHSVPRSQNHYRRRDDCNQRQELDHFTGLVRRHVQIHLKDAR